MTAMTIISAGCVIGGNVCNIVALLVNVIVVCLVILVLVNASTVIADPVANVTSSVVAGFVARVVITVVIKVVIHKAGCIILLAGCGSLSVTVHVVHVDINEVNFVNVGILLLLGAVVFVVIEVGLIAGKVRIFLVSATAGYGCMHGATASSVFHSGLCQLGMARWLRSRLAN